MDMAEVMVSKITQVSWLDHFFFQWYFFSFSKAMGDIAVSKILKTLKNSNKIFKSFTSKIQKKNTSIILFEFTNYLI